MRRFPAFLLVCALACVPIAAQELPKATVLGGNPFFIKKTWVIGGEGNWDYLAFDPEALQLFVAHGASVQVVDVDAGTLAGQIDGMREAHGIALDDAGALGFVSDGPANRVRIFDRESLQVVASVPTGPNPRAVVYEPVTKLVFAICTLPLGENSLAQLGGNRARAGGGPGGTAPSSQQAGQQAARADTGQGRAANGGARGDQGTLSIVTVIDSQTRQALGDLLLPGRLGFAQADGRGRVYINVVDRSRIAYFDAQSVVGLIRQQAASSHADALPVIDWSGGRPRPGIQQVENRLHHLRLGPACQNPQSLALDGEHLRLFVACDNQKMEVLDTGSGDIVATLTIGPGTDAIGYDPARGLIYTANGGGLGSLTVIRQDVTDGYHVIQDLPTRQRARTLAVNPVSGEVYLVTNLEGFDLNQKGVGGGTYSLPVVQATPVKGSFQVLVVGN